MHRLPPEAMGWHPNYIREKSGDPDIDRYLRAFSTLRCGSVGEARAEADAFEARTIAAWRRPDAYREPETLQ